MPTFPLLFVLSLEPLLATIRANKEIKGIEVSGQEHKASAFADDIMLCVFNPTQTLPTSLADLKKYGAISNFKVNVEKT